MTTPHACRQDRRVRGLCSRRSGARRRGRATAAVVPDAVGQGARGDRLLPAAAAHALRRPRGRPGRLLHRASSESPAPAARPAGSPACSACTRGRSRCSPTRPSRRSGAGHERPAVLVVRADRQGRPGRGRLHAQRHVVASRPAARTPVGAARRARLQRRGQGRRLPDLHDPARDYEIVDVWNVVGLRGTGSNDIVVEDVFVPEAFTLSMSDTGRCFGPGQEQNPGDLYKLPFHSLFTTTIATPDRRHGRRAPTPSTSRCSRSASARPTSARRRRSTRSPRCGSPSRHRDRRRLGAADAQHPRGAGLRRPGREDPDPAAAQGAPRPGARHRSARSARSTACSRPPAGVRWPRAPTCSAPGATPTPAVCTPPTTPSGRCRCSARSSSATRSTRDVLIA